MALFSIVIGRSPVTRIWLLLSNIKLRADCSDKVELFAVEKIRVPGNNILIAESHECSFVLEDEMVSVSLHCLDYNIIDIKGKECHNE